MNTWNWILASLLILGGAGAVHAEEPFETFDVDPTKRWEYVADTVMGGVSSGALSFESEDLDSYARLAGTVSTANNGGFIQFRHLLATPLSKGAEGLRLRVRGNGEVYFVHVRTKGTRLPWHYYQAQFETTANWTEIRLPWSAFKPSASLLRDTPAAGKIKSVGVVAYGRDHSAKIDVSEVDFF